MAGGTKTRRKPEVQAKGVSPISGTAPPAEHRWQPGQSGNPAGRMTAGAYVKEHLNRMSEMPLEDIKAIFDNPASPMAAKIAARTWIDAASIDRNSSGSPIAGGEFDRILDRTLGKPMQAVDLTSKGNEIYLKDIRGVSDDDL